MTEATPGGSHTPDIPAGRDLLGFGVAASVIHDEDIKIRIGQAGQRLQAPVEVRRPATGANQHCAPGKRGVVHVQSRVIAGAARCPGARTSILP